MTVTVYNQAGEPVGEMELNDRIWAAEGNQGLLHQAVVAVQANARRGTSDTLRRGEVAGGGRKPWRQKGTGRARAGSIRSPLWRKGGVAFGPHPRSYRQELPRKMRHAALRAALSARAQAGDVVVLDQLEMAQPKTHDMATLLGRLKADRALVVTEETRREVVLSTRNIAKSETVTAADLSAYTVLRHPKLVLTRAAAQRIEEVLG